MTVQIRHFFPLFFLLLFSVQLLAQPGNDGYDMHGCHFTKSKIPVEAIQLMETSSECGSNARSDSIDVLNYAIDLDVTQFSQQMIHASCEVTFTAKMDGIEALPLDLLNLSVDSVKWQGNHLAFDYDDLLLNIYLSTPVNIGDTAEVVVFYHGKPTPDNYWGGFSFENGYAYNLGIGLSSNPYNFGRSWHPCFDNFVERATYDINIVTNDGRKGYAIGKFLGETDLGGGQALRQYRMNQPLPTYLVGVAASNYAEINQLHAGIYGDYPILLVAKPADTAHVRNDFAYLGDAVDALESWFGPYIWEQVGYVLTVDGAMEHASLIAYPESSTGGGPTFGMNRLMAHELGHQWWGNVTTLSCPDNMWIKEGNAEYSAHLFTEYTFGKEAFLDQVKDNHNNDVLRNAHLDDDGFWPLSGIPYEHTYGTTTYRKGASVMHNLRGYLGDTLFSKGMTSILETFKYESVDAELFRDQLSAATGVDLTSFFDDWIFSPGFACYELDSVEIEPTPIPEEWKATVHVQQKLRAAPHFHTNAPVSITFFDENWNTYTTQFTMSGEFGSAELTVPFQPVWQILNDDQLLNLARTQSRKTAYSTGTLSIPYSGMGNFEIKNLPGDSALVSIVHYWAGADPVGPEVEGVTVSSGHYWRLGGILPEGFKAKALLEYDGGGPNDFDYNLTQNTEDSLILIWRAKPGDAWAHYPFYKKVPLSPNDGQGFIRVDTMLPGDYAFANGDLPLATSLLEVEKPVAQAEIFPNPTGHSFQITGLVPGAGQVSLAVFDMVGKLLKQSEIQTADGFFLQQVDVHDLPPGMYLVKAADKAGGAATTIKLLKQ